MKLQGNSPSSLNNPQWRGDTMKRPLPVENSLLEPTTRTVGVDNDAAVLEQNGGRSPEQGSPSKRSKPNTKEEEDAEDARLRLNEIERRRCASRESSRRTRERERRRFDYFSSTKYKLEDANARIKIENQRLRSLIQLLKHTKATIISGDNPMSAPRFQIPNQQQPKAPPPAATTSSNNPGVATNANQLLQMSNFMGNSMPQANIQNDLLKLLLLNESKSSPSSFQGTSGNTQMPTMSHGSTPTFPQPGMKQQQQHQQAQDLSSLLSANPSLLSQLLGPNNKVDGNSAGATTNRNNGAGTSNNTQQMFPPMGHGNMVDINRQFLERLKHGNVGGNGSTTAAAPVPLAPPLWGNGGLL